ncbi:MAG: HNH endonuclease [Polyangiaceae bacterium]|nr:HNH endonuclease [Polyangiaceae bacterium]
MPGVPRFRHYKVEFTAKDEYVSLLNQARDLLAHADGGRSLEAIRLRAMRLLPPEPGADPRQRGRHIPAPVRRQVAARDGERCSFVDDRGQRCRETSGLEMHHDHAFALGGPATDGNLSLRCKAHNALAAEQDFGRDFMQRKKGSRGLEPALARHS